jgi:hypothetical protein
VIARLPCSNGSNTFCSTAGSTPMPVSVTLTRTFPPGPSAVRTVTLPCARVNLMAFFSRFKNTWRILTGSASSVLGPAGGSSVKVTPFASASPRTASVHSASRR